MLSMKVFTECVRSCNNMRLDTLVSIIERCKTMDQNKSLCPSWNMCNYITEVTMENDNGKLAFYALEGVVVAALETAGRTYSSTLLDASWAIPQCSMRQKKVRNP